MRSALLTLLAFLSASLIFLSCEQLKEDKGMLDSLATALSARVILPNGWSLSPAGKSIRLGDLPMNIVTSPHGKFLAVVNSGYGKQSIILINSKSETILDEIQIVKSWYGLIFDSSETKLYASGGNDNQILIYDIKDNRLFKSDSLILGKHWPENKISPTGITLDEDKKILYITTKEDSALYITDLVTKISKKIKLGHEAYTCLLSPDHKMLYISLWGGSKVVVFDTEKREVIKSILVGDHPNELTMTKNGKHLFVAHANENAVSVIETSSGKVVEILNTALYANAPAGSTPNAVALSENDSRLYVANADNNCLAVFDVENPGESKSMGFIPTGWYPTSVKVLNHKIWVANGKGGSSLANPKGPDPYEKRNSETQYIGGLLKGTLSIVPEPGKEALTIYSDATFTNTPYSKEIEKLSAGEEGNPIPRKANASSPIKYVFYVIKENRTYDQVLGDIAEGNGDSSLCLFPEKITPNHHALAREFVLLDNFYVNAEVSADGHNWTTAAYATDFVEKTWPANYSGRGGNYDFEGSRAIAYPKAGFIWDYCQRAGVSYRSYGEFAGDGHTNMKALEGHFDRDYSGWDLSISDLERYSKWQSDFDSLLAIHAVPQLNIVRFPNDHTAGLQIGMPSPRAFVAQNDLAVGKFIEHIGASKIWSESAIFILEDDAQNGPDHVDAHRSTAYVISPYVKRNAVVSRAYSTASMLRTIELILGLPPMSQYDAAAIPMWECFTATPDSKNFVSLPASYNIKELNKEKTALSEQSAHFNLTEVDAVPDLEFSRIIWKAIKGIHSEMPAPVRSAFVKPGTEDGDDD